MDLPIEPGDFHSLMLVITRGYHWNPHPTSIAGSARPSRAGGDRCYRGCNAEVGKLAMHGLRGPSGNLLHSFGKSPSLVSKFIISMVIFHSYVQLPEGKL